MECEGDQKYSVFGLGRCSLFAPLVLMYPRAVFGLIFEHRNEGALSDRHLLFLFNLVYPKIILHEYFDKILLDEKK